MPSQHEQVALTLETARTLRTAGASYREIGRQLGLTSSQLSHVRRTLKREKGGRTRLLNADPQATNRDLPVGRSVLPAGPRRSLVAAGLRTLGDLADRIEDSDRPGLEAMPGIGPYRTRLIKGLLDQYGLLAGTSDLQAEVERLFPEFGDAPPNAARRDANSR